MKHAFSEQRLLTLAEAASYCRLSNIKFKRECPVAPCFYGDSQGLYDKKLIDLWIDRVNPIFENKIDWLSKLD